MIQHQIGAELKRKNRNDIYRFLHSHGCASRQLITRELELSLPTVTQNLSELMEEDLVIEKGSFGNTGGRRAKGYSVNPQARFAIGIDINKTRFSAVILDIAGNIHGTIREYIDFNDSDEYYKYVAERVNALISKSNVNKEKILGVGIATQAIIAADKRTVSYGEVLGITGNNVDTIGRYIDYPKQLLHDSDMAAFAELWFNPESKGSLYLSLSTNLGGAYIGDGNNCHSGRFGLARLEHMTLVPNGKKCYCGQNGCADVYCSSGALTGLVPDGRLQSFFDALDNGDEEISEAWDKYLNMLSIVINNARLMFDDNVILGGYLAEHIDKHLKELQKRTYKLNSFDKNADYIQLCRQKVEPVCVGAALQFIEAFISSI